MALHSLFASFVPETVTGMEDGQIIDVLDVALLEVGRNAVLIAQEVGRIQCFSLGVGDGRDFGASWECAEADEVAASVL